MNFIIILFCTYHTMVFINPCIPVSLFDQETWYWQGDVSADAVVMSGVRCSGTELTLDQCLHHGKHVLCPKGGGRFSAGVSCTQSKKLWIKDTTDIKIFLKCSRLKYNSNECHCATKICETTLS